MLYGLDFLDGRKIAQLNLQILQDSTAIDYLRQSDMIYPRFFRSLFQNARMKERLKWVYICQSYRKKCKWHHCYSPQNICNCMSR